MEFFLTLAILAVVAAAPSGGIVLPIYRMKRPYAKPVSVVLGVMLFLFFAAAGFVILVIESARRGHPF